MKRFRSIVGDVLIGLLLILPAIVVMGLIVLYDYQKTRKEVIQSKQRH